MPEQVRTKRTKKARELQKEVEAAVDTKTQQLKEETDALLQEIDDLLDDVIGESTAQAFVSSYQQKGGE